MLLKNTTLAALAAFALMLGSTALLPNDPPPPIPHSPEDGMETAMAAETAAAMAPALAATITALKTMAATALTAANSMVADPG